MPTPSTSENEPKMPRNAGDSSMAPLTAGVPPNSEMCGFVSSRRQTGAPVGFPTRHQDCKKAAIRVRNLISADLLAMWYVLCVRSAYSEPRAG